VDPRENDEQRIDWERQCVERARRGDLSAFGEIYHAMAPLLYRRVLLPKLGNVAAAEDALADTFRVAIERLAQYTPTGVSIYFWLARIAHNKAIDFYRVQATTGRKIVDLKNLLLPLMKPTSAPDELFELAVDAHVVQGRIASVLADMNPRYKRAIELRFFEDRSREEGAAALGIKLGTFDVLVLRALRAFKKSWDALALETEEAHGTH
jgi:RNA polymerase sigma factor (sigma-70 family)